MRLSPGQNHPDLDLVLTPPSMAEAIVQHFKPSGTALDPCRGEGAFYNALCAYPSVCHIEWCEMREGRDFFRENRRFDWIITNPPWSKMRAFLVHAMRLADDVVFLATLTHFVTRRRDQDIYDAGFAAREALLLPQPPQPWPSSGFLLAAYHIQRGYTGDLHFNRSMLPAEQRTHFQLKAKRIRPKIKVPSCA